jgi:hypothetical protein
MQGDRTTPSTRRLLGAMLAAGPEGATRENLTRSAGPFVHLVLRKGLLLEDKGFARGLYREGLHEPPAAWKPEDVQPLRARLLELLSRTGEPRLSS